MHEAFINTPLKVHLLLMLSLKALRRHPGSSLRPLLPQPALPREGGREEGTHHSSWVQRFWGGMGLSTCACVFRRGGAVAPQKAGATQGWGQPFTPSLAASWPNAAVFPRVHIADKKTCHSWMLSVLGPKRRCLGTGSGPSQGLSQGDRGPDQDQARDEAGVLGDQLGTKPGTKPGTEPGCSGTQTGPSWGGQGLFQDQAGVLATVGPA